jgi:hypothetical protein
MSATARNSRLSRITLRRPCEQLLERQELTGFPVADQVGGAHRAASDQPLARSALPLLEAGSTPAWRLAAWSWCEKHLRAGIQSLIAGRHHPSRLAQNEACPQSSRSFELAPISLLSVLVLRRRLRQRLVGHHLHRVRRRAPRGGSGRVRGQTTQA